MPRRGAAGEIPMPAPWAIAAAILALIAFGVFVGSLVSPSQEGAAPILLAASPRTASARWTSSALTTSGTTSGATSGAQPPETSVEATPPGGSGAESERSASPQTAPQTTNGPASKGGKQAGGGESGSNGGHRGPQRATAGLPPVKHVFLIVLSDEGFDAAFGAASKAPYLAKTLRRQGELLSNYYAVANSELANEIALISGQGPNPQTAEDCPVYADLAPGATDGEGQAQGSGCVFPATTLTLAGQLEAKGKTWRSYVEGVGDGAAGQPPSCRHPASGASDANHAPSVDDGYVTWRDPFVYFHSLTDSQACANNDVGLDRLAIDLGSAGTTPSLAYVAPNRCNDASPEACAPGKPAGLAPAEAFLRKVVPAIEGSPAYREGGLIAITFDQAPQSGPEADASGCCVDGPFPNLTDAPAGSGTSSEATQTAPAGETTGGGKVGLLLISKYVKPGSLDATGDYNHFSMLRSIENLFGLAPLGYAGAPGLLAFDESVFNAAGAV